jgi:hypothetical protein
LVFHLKKRRRRRRKREKINKTKNRYQAVFCYAIIFPLCLIYLKNKF